MPLGLENAYGLEAIQQGLRQRIFDQLKQRQMEQEMSLADRKMSLDELDRRDRTRILQQAEQDRQQAIKDKADNAANASAVTAFTMTPAGSPLQPQQAIRGRLLGLPIDEKPGVAGPAAISGLPSLEAPTTDATALPSEATPTSYLRGMTTADVKTQEAADLAARKQDEIERANAANEALKSSIADIQRQVKEGDLNNKEAMLKIQERLAAVAELKAQKGATARPLPASEADKLSEIRNSLTSLDELGKTLSETDKATGTSAQFGAMLPNMVTDLTGLGAQAKSRQGTIDRVKQIIGKALEGGVLRKEDEAKYAKILPTISDAPSVAASKLAGLRLALQDKLREHSQGLTDAGYDMTNFDNRPVAVAKPSAADLIKKYSQ